MDNDQFGRPPKNVAAWALKPKERPFVVGNAPYTSPPAGCLVIRVVDVAINPIDFKMQDSALFPLQYPTVFGTDVAGEIVELGPDVDTKKFKPGARVIAHMDSYTSNDPSRGAFQRYAIARAISTCPIPYSIPTSTAVVLPLSISTASAGLFQKHYLHLPLPTLSPPSPSIFSTITKPLTLLIWGGSSSIGSSTIQLARSSIPNLQILTTCSPANFTYCTTLGATKCFDYHLSTVEADLIAACKHTTVLGAFHAAGDAAAVVSCAQVLDRVEGKTVVVTVTGLDDERKGKVPGSARVERISSGDIFDKHGGEVGRGVWQDFLPGALAEEVIKPKPDAWVVGQGLRSVQRGVDEVRRGVSARKVVVSNIQESGK